MESNKPIGPIRRRIEKILLMHFEKFMVGWTLFWILLALYSCLTSHPLK